MTSQLDLDQGGTSRLWVQQWMGPSIGWIWIPRQNTLPITVAGTYVLDLSTSLVTVNVSVGTVTIVLPPATNPSFPGAGTTQVGKFADNTVTVVDIGGHALTNVITVNAAAGENIAGSATMQIAFNYGAITFLPVSAQQGWDTVVSNTANPIVYTPPWTGATAYSLQKRLSTFILPEDFGAAGDNTTDDTTAVNAAIAFAVSEASAGRQRTVFFGQAYRTLTGFLMNAPVGGIFGIVLKGNGKNHPTLTTNQNVPVLTINMASGAIFGCEVSDMGIAGTGSFTTNNHGIVIANNDTTHNFSYYAFSRLHVQQCYNGIYFSNPSSGGCDWGIIDDCDLRSNYRGIYRLCGGTGCVYWGGNIVCSGSPDANGAAITIGATGVAAIIGDLTIGGIQMGGTGAGVVINDVSGSYGANVGVSDCQMDAGINPAFHLTNIKSPHVSNISYGGASGPNLVDGTSADCDLDEKNISGITTGGFTDNNHALSPGAGGLEYQITGGTDLTITGIAGGYDSRRFEIYNLGTANNVVLKNESASSSASNRFHLGADVTLAPGQSISLRYVALSGMTIVSRWVRRGGS